MKLDWNKILRFVDPDRRAEVRQAIEEDYSDVVTTNHPVVEDPANENGRVLRFKRDPMTSWIANVALSRPGCGLNELWDAALHRYDGRWSRRSMMRFYRGMGYSLCGFAEVFLQGGKEWLR